MQITPPHLHTYLAVDITAHVPCSLLGSAMTIRAWYDTGMYQVCCRVFFLKLLYALLISVSEIQSTRVDHKPILRSILYRGALLPPPGILHRVCKINSAHHSVLACRIYVRLQLSLDFGSAACCRSQFSNSSRIHARLSSRGKLRFLKVR